MKKLSTALSFNDVTIIPKFSKVKSRRDVQPKGYFFGRFALPIVSSNMQAVTDAKLANEMIRHNACACLHRFQSVEDNVKQFLQTNKQAWGSFGIGRTELERAEALSKAGCTVLVLDIAHGASMNAVEQIKDVRKVVSPDTLLVVGNFATGATIKDFLYHVGDDLVVDGFKLSIGSGAACQTTSTVGCGLPAFATITDCREATDLPLILDGGINNSSTFVKAIGAGADVVMCGRLFAATEESPAEVVIKGDQMFKVYSGSASIESYKTQGKVAGHRVAEGQTFEIPLTGKVEDVLQHMEASLRSTMSYVGARDLDEYRELCDFAQVTNSGRIEGLPENKR